MAEYIILKNVGRWVLHEAPATYPSRKEAEHEAISLLCDSFVVSIEEIVSHHEEVMGLRARLLPERNVRPEVELIDEDEPK